MKDYENDRKYGGPRRLLFTLKGTMRDRVIVAPLSISRTKKLRMRMCFHFMNEDERFTPMKGNSAKYGKYLGLRNGSTPEVDGKWQRSQAL